MKTKPMVNVKKLKAKMKEKGWTRRDLADAAGMPYDTVWSLLNGRRPNTSTATLRKLAAALEMPYDELLGDGQMDESEEVSGVVKRLVEAASQLSKERQEEALRIIEVLRSMDQENNERQWPNGTMRALVEIAEVLRARGGNEDILLLLDALIGKPRHGGTFVDPRSGQGPDQPTNNL